MRKLRGKDRGAGTQPAGAKRQRDPARGDGLPDECRSAEELPGYGDLFHAVSVLHVFGDDRAVQDSAGGGGGSGQFSRGPGFFTVAGRGGGHPQPTGTDPDDGGFYPGEAGALERGYCGVAETKNLKNPAFRECERECER